MFFQHLEIPILTTFKEEFANFFIGLSDGPSYTKYWTYIYDSVWGSHSVTHILITRTPSWMYVVFNMCLKVHDESYREVWYICISKKDAKDLMTVQLFLLSLHNCYYFGPTSLISMAVHLFSSYSEQNSNSVWFLKYTDVQLKLRTYR